MYSSNSNCASKTGTVATSIFLVYGGDTCVPGYNSNFMAANDYSGIECIFLTLKSICSCRSMQ